MADLGQVLRENDAIIGVVVGAGLTYLLGLMNRRHQEKREDKTRWYEARLQAYAELSREFSNSLRVAWKEDKSEEDTDKAAQELSWAAGAVRLVGSEEVITASEFLVSVLVHELQTPPPVSGETTHAVFARFEAAARKDLGH